MGTLEFFSDKLGAKTNLSEIGDEKWPSSKEGAVIYLVGCLVWFIVNCLIWFILIAIDQTQ